MIQFAVIHLEFSIGTIVDWIGSIPSWIESEVPYILAVLVVLDTALLVLALFERHAREKHIAAMREYTDILSRHDYEQTIARGVSTATKRIYLYWHSLHEVDASRTYKAINQGLIKANRKSSIEVKLIVAGEANRVGAAYELKKKDVEVHFRNSLTISDLRFSLFDDEMTVFGMPEAEVKDGKPSRHGVDINSRKLNALFTKYFDEQFANEQTITFNKFVASLCREPMEEDSTNTVEMVAKQLRVNRKVIEEACPDLPKSETEEKPPENEAPR